MGITPGPWAYDEDRCEIFSTTERHESYDEWYPGRVVDVVYVRGAMGGEDSAADIALIAAAPEIAAALVAIVDAFREPHYGDREQQADSVFDAMERTGALALAEKLKGIL